MIEFLDSYDTQSLEMSAKQVAAVLHCTKAMVYKLIEQDELTYFKVGNRFWISKESLKEYILRNRGGRNG